MSVLAVSIKWLEIELLKASLAAQLVCCGAPVALRPLRLPQGMLRTEGLHHCGALQEPVVALHCQERLEGAREG